jgi:dGTPase
MTLPSLFSGPGAAPYASQPAQSRGRRYPQPPAPPRDDFQRDRDRIVHSTAFRRLVYKTQVFLNHEGDLFRTRLTHSLEVAQLARSVARALGLNEDLVEAIALAHDLGHTPFGHAGQDALNECLHQADTQSDGFEHNLQSLRVVDLLEERYPHFDGLNLTFETREGILKHCSRRNAQHLFDQGEQALTHRFLEGGQPSLEAQLCNLADAIAYNAHDIDDGVRSGLLTLEQLQDAPLFGVHLHTVKQDHPQLCGNRVLFEAVRRMLCHLVHDLTQTSQQALMESKVQHVDEVRQARRPLIQFSPGVQTQSQQLKQFLRDNLYWHPQVARNTERAKQVIHDLFGYYCKHPEALSTDFIHHGNSLRTVADHIACMTDRFALKEHEQQTGQRLFG